MSPIKNSRLQVWDVETCVTGCFTIFHNCYVQSSDLRGVITCEQSGQRGQFQPRTLVKEAKIKIDLFSFLQSFHCFSKDFRLNHEWLEIKLVHLNYLVILCGDFQFIQHSHWRWYGLRKIMDKLIGKMINKIKKLGQVEWFWEKDVNKL